jgi:hypothetical protein
MDLKLNNLLERFKTKGFMAIELPGLVKDVLNIVGTSGYSTITSIDQELEDLGWGIGIMDKITHKLITSLLKDNSSADVVSNFINLHEHNERKEENYGRSRRN